MFFILLKQINNKKGKSDQIYPGYDIYIGEVKLEKITSNSQSLPYRSGPPEVGRHLC